MNKEQCHAPAQNVQTTQFEATNVQPATSTTFDKEYLSELAKRLYETDYYENILQLLDEPISTSHYLSVNELLQVTSKIVDYFKIALAGKTNYYPFDLFGAEIYFSEIRDCLINPIEYVKCNEKEPQHKEGVIRSFERYYGYLYHDIKDFIPELKHKRYFKLKERYDAINENERDAPAYVDLIKELNKLENEVKDIE